MPLLLSGGLEAQRLDQGRGWNASLPGFTSVRSIRRQPDHSPDQIRLTPDATRFRSASLRVWVSALREESPAVSWTESIAPRAGEMLLGQAQRPHARLRFRTDPRRAIDWFDRRLAPRRMVRADGEEIEGGTRPVDLIPISILQVHVELGRFVVL